MRVYSLTNLSALMLFTVINVAYFLSDSRRKRYTDKIEFCIDKIALSTNYATSVINIEHLYFMFIVIFFISIGEVQQ